MEIIPFIFSFFKLTYNDFQQFEQILLTSIQNWHQWKPKQKIWPRKTSSFSPLIYKMCINFTKSVSVISKENNFYFPFSLSTLRWKNLCCICDIHQEFVHYDFYSNQFSYFSMKSDFWNQIELEKESNFDFKADVFRF